MPKRIVVIGGGASGVLLSAHLLRDSQDVAVTIVERRPELGAGAAYATNHPNHLLNVRVRNMSAFPDDPGHFQRWLMNEPGTGRACAEADGFAPRHLYRGYLASLLAPHLETGRLACRHGEADRIVRSGSGVAVGLGTRLEQADAVVLATGNEGPGLPPAPWRIEGWGDAAPGRLDPEAPVVIIGTGLTMADRVIALLQAGHTGPITAVSRRGLMPQGHRPVNPERFDAAEIPFGAPLGTLTAWMRRRAREFEARGGDWRSVVDALRPHTVALWRRLPPEERRRFLRHARPFWDMHRHRVAPSAAVRLSRARSEGQLMLVAAHVTGFEPRDGGVRVHLERRRTRVPLAVDAAAVFECRGRSTDVRLTENPLLRSLFSTGQARPDELRLGLEVSEACALIAADGTPSPALHALGPVTAGVFWEIVAVPDIRQQAANLARTLAL